MGMGGRMGSDGHEEGIEGVDPSLDVGQDGGVWVGMNY